ncbi:MAG: zf-HC2 domain-containing protein [Candidatus Latescibacteria bacterium]|nr:zf-HC2 domain-containing protein [Candidatus Latescibacterota bacterium]
MRCRETRQWLKSYLQGKLGGPFAAKIGRHLESCARCSQELTLEKTILNGAETYPMLAVPYGFADEVIEKLTERKSVEEVTTGELQDLPGFLIRVLVTNLKLTKDLVLLELRLAWKQILDVSAYAADSLRYAEENITATSKLIH